MRMWWPMPALLLCAQTLCAQKVLVQHAYNVHGGFAFAHTEENHPEFDSERLTLVFDPSFSYHVWEDLSLGASVKYEYVDTRIIEESSEHRSIRRSLDIGPKVRYYFHTQNFAPFVEGSLNYSVVFNDNTRGFSYALGAGITYFFTGSIALEPSVSFVSRTFARPDYDSMSWQFGIGLTYHISD